MDKVSNIISCNWVGLVLSPYCTLMPWAQGPGLMETQMRTSIKDLQRCHGLRLVTVGHPVALSPGSVVTSMACCSSYCKPKTKLFFSVGSELPLLWEESSVITKSESIFNGNLHGHVDLMRVPASNRSSVELQQESGVWSLGLDSFPKCTMPRRHAVDAAMGSENPGSDHLVLILFPSVQCP